MKRTKVMKSVRIIESANFSPVQTRIKNFQLEETQQANIRSKLLIKTLHYITLQEVIVLLNLLKVNNKDNIAKSVDAILVPVLLIFSILKNCVT